MGQARRRSRLRVGAALALGMLVAGPGAVATEPCAAWPGEPSPLPQVSDSDGMLGRWAALRARELATAARSSEQISPLRAHRLWQRVLCLDPGNDAAVAGLTRTPVVAVHTPNIVTRDPGGSDPDAWSGLSGSLYVKLPRPSPPARKPAPPRAPDTAAFDRALEQLESRVRGAEFEAALESATRGRAAAQALGAAADAKRAARLEVLAATAALALGRGAEAETSFALALDSDPELTLDPLVTSPKVRRALERVRKERTQ